MKTSSVHDLAVDVINSIIQVSFVYLIHRLHFLLFLHAKFLETRNNALISFIQQLLWFRAPFLLDDQILLPLLVILTRSRLAP